ncbi:hypothetical protein Cni_G03693 [Canna indica]|uniref:Uncharacterized protein n=1 Tax=Canna indica TaxID=4628 RepID=A0AAQ3Q216_9LILI|nr:hypothetical protein Cni_G03693 [Canna indica]
MGVRSYRALCRFLAAVALLLGVWVHQNLELGNVVCVLWGFLSVVGVRVIPQELGPLGLDAGPLLWAPVFEILADADGSPSCFFLHGRGEGEEDCVFPGSVQSIDPSCNVLLLEVDAHRKDPAFPPNPPRLPHSRSSSVISDWKDPTFLRKLRRSDTNNPAAAPPSSSFVTFSKLPFSDRRRLLDQVADRVRLEVPSDLAAAPLFDRCHPCDDADLLASRWSELVKMHKQLGRGRIDRKSVELAPSLGEHKATAYGDWICLIRL